MIRRILAILTFLLLLSAAALADNPVVLEGVFTYGTDFAIRYPIDWDIIPDESGDTETDKNCGLLASPEDTGLNVEIYLSALEGLEEYTLLDMDAASLSEFADSLIENTASLHYVYHDTIYTTANGVPFLVFDAADEYGPMFVAETILDGWMTTIIGYAYTDGTFTTCRKLTDDDYNLFTTMVESYALMSMEFSLF